MTQEKPEHLQKGTAAEELAARFLHLNGLKLLEKNFRCSYGEIDLIMQDGTSTVFIEVRLRSSNAFGGAAASISPSKQQKLKRSAEYYLQIHGTKACRFDAVLMETIDLNAVEWLKNIF